MCGGAAALRSIHVAAENGMTGQTPPRCHLPPLCQFVTAHPSVAVPSFNIEQEQEEEKGKEEGNNGSGKDCSP